MLCKHGTDSAERCYECELEHRIDLTKSYNAGDNMKQFKCDICNAEVTKAYDLITLHKDYKFDNIEHVCRDCKKEIDDIVTKINTIYEDLFLLMKKYRD